MNKNIYRKPESALSKLDSSGIDVRRPISLWLILILASIVIALSLFGSIITAINIIKNSGQGVDIVGLIKFYSIKISILIFSSAALITVIKRKPYGWYISILVPVCLVVFISIKMLWPDLFPSIPSLAPKNDYEKNIDTSIYFLQIIALLYWVWTLVNGDAREYFGKE